MDAHSTKSSMTSHANVAHDEIVLKNYFFKTTHRTRHKDKNDHAGNRQKKAGRMADAYIEKPYLHRMLHDQVITPSQSSITLNLIVS